MDIGKSMQRDYLRKKIERYTREAEQITATDEASRRRLSILNYKISAYQNRLSDISRRIDYAPEHKTLWGSSTI